MPRDEFQLNELTQAELLIEIAGNLRYLRRVLSEFEPLLTAVRGNGNGDAVRAAGVRRVMRRGTRNAATPAQH